MIRRHFEIMATHRLRVPSLVDYRRHSSRSWPPIAYAFLHLSTIVATLRVHGHPSLTRSFTCRLSSPLREHGHPSLTRSFTCRLSSPLRDHGHPSLTRSFTCRLSSPLFEIMATHRLRVPSLVDYRRHSSRSWPPIAYAFLHLSTIVATLRVRSVIHKIRYCWAS